MPQNSMPPTRTQEDLFISSALERVPKKYTYFKKGKICIKITDIQFWKKVIHTVDNFLT